jgi:hypothetical protein
LWIVLRKRKRILGSGFCDCSELWVRRVTPVVAIPVPITIPVVAIPIVAIPIVAIPIAAIPMVDIPMAVIPMVGHRVQVIGGVGGGLHRRYLLGSPRHEPLQPDVHQLGGGMGMGGEGGGVCGYAGMRVEGRGGGITSGRSSCRSERTVREEVFDS